MAMLMILTSGLGAVILQKGNIAILRTERPARTRNGNGGRKDGSSTGRKRNRRRAANTPAAEAGGSGCRIPGDGSAAPCIQDDGR